MSSAEYALRLFVRPPSGGRIVATLLAHLVALTYNMHRAQDAPALTVAELLPPVLPDRALSPEEAAADMFAFVARLDR